MWEMMMKKILRTGRVTVPIPSPAPAPGEPEGEVACTAALPREHAPVVDGGAEREPAAGTRRALGLSLHVRHLDAGSCNACDWELNTLLNPVYDLQRFGVDIVASPRHADMVVVTGPVTRNLHDAVLRTVEAAPRPCLVAAVGDCACGSGPFRDSYATTGGADRVLPVHARIPGCPPRPEDIIRGILRAARRL